MLGIWVLVPAKPGMGILIAVILMDGAVLLVQLQLGRRAVRAEGASLQSLCASARVLVLSAGQLRSAAPGARIGFHGYRLLGPVATVDVAEEEARDRDQLRS